MLARRTLFAAVIALELLARGAAADPTPAPVPASVAPRALSPLRAEYPEGAQGNADVLLRIVVNVDGTVRSARVEAGAEPFASAAVAASSGWRFEPAAKDGKPFAAAIKALIHFEAPPPPPPPEPPPEPAPGVAPKSPGAKPPRPPPPAAIEVNVKGEVPAPGATSLSRAEVRLLPGAFGDPFRALDVLPGVTPLASGVPYFYVRGAPPANVGYFLDGISVPLLFHIGLGPSVIHPAIMDRVDLYSGGYPARFGRFAGGLVAGEVRDPAPEWHAEGTLRLIDAGAMVEGPLPGGRGAFFAAGRVSFVGPLLQFVTSHAGSGPTLDLGYWDYQTRATVHVTARDDLTVFAFGAHDFLGEKGDEKRGKPDKTLFDTTFHRLDLRYDHRLGGAEDRVRQAITFGFDRTSFSRGGFADDRSVASRTEIIRRVSDTVLLRAGLDAQLDGYQADLKRDFPEATAFTSLFSDRIEITMGARADAVINVTPRLEVTPGVRLDYFEMRGQSAVAVDPRLAARFAITKQVRLIEAHGLASQPPSFVLPGPGFVRDLTGGLQRSFQSSLGVEADLPSDVTGSVTLFHDAFFNMTDPLGTAPPPTSGRNFSDNFNTRTTGWSMGMEVMIRRRLTRRLGGIISYTLARSQRSFDRTTAASAFDRTHVLNVAGSYDFGRGFKAGTRTMFYTGFPATLIGPSTGEVIRLPPFFRFDFRVEKRWSVASGRGWVSLVLEALNTFGAKETVQQQCIPGGDCSSTRIGPITVPSVGLEGGF